MDAAGHKGASWVKQLKEGGHEGWSVQCSLETEVSYWIQGPARSCFQGRDRTQSKVGRCGTMGGGGDCGQLGRASPQWFNPIQLLLGRNAGPVLSDVLVSKKSWTFGLL